MPVVRQCMHDPQPTPRSPPDTPCPAISGGRGQQRWRPAPGTERPLVPVPGPGAPAAPPACSPRRGSDPAGTPPRMLHPGAPLFGRRAGSAPPRRFAVLVRAAAPAISTWALRPARLRCCIPPQIYSAFSGWFGPVRCRLAARSSWSWPWSMGGVSTGRWRIMQEQRDLNSMVSNIQSNHNKQDIQVAAAAGFTKLTLMFFWPKSRDVLDELDSALDSIRILVRFVDWRLTRFQDNTHDFSDLFPPQHKLANQRKNLRHGFST